MIIDAYKLVFIGQIDPKFPTDFICTQVIFLFLGLALRLHMLCSKLDEKGSENILPSYK
jgi:hypothetical protein